MGGSAKISNTRSLPKMPCLTVQTQTTLLLHRLLQNVYEIGPGQASHVGFLQRSIATFTVSNFHNLS